MSDRHSLDEFDPDIRDRLLALEEHVPLADWQDVVRRSHQFTSRRLFATGSLVRVAAAVLLLAAGAVAARGLSPVGGHTSATRAAAAAQPLRSLTDFALGAPPIAPEAIASQTRLIASVTLRRDGVHRLYLAPTQQGGFCYEWTAGPRGCGTKGSPLDVTWGSGRVVGTASSAVSSVEVKFTDGSSAKPKVFWVSTPIDTGFFLYEIPAGKTVYQVVANNARGQLACATWYSV
jgi:hypothetical protein